MRTLITVSGNLTSQPVSRWTKDEVQVVDFGLACNSRRQDRATGLWEDGEPTFFSVTCWRRLAENVVTSLNKGDPVLVHARFASREYVRSDGTVKVELKLDAQAIGPDLGRSTATVHRGASRSAPGGGSVELEVSSAVAGVPVPRQSEGDPEPAGDASDADVSRSGPLVAVPAAEA